MEPPSRLENLTTNFTQGMIAEVRTFVLVAVKLYPGSSASGALHRPRESLPLRREIHSLHETHRHRAYRRHAMHEQRCLPRSEGHSGRRGRSWPGAHSDVAIQKRYNVH